jgi:two-component system response regulator NreC
MRVLLVDDHAIVRQGIEAVLTNEPEVEVIGAAGTGREAVHLARELSPEIVLMDLSMPDLGGVEATRLIVGESPQIKVLCLSMHADRSMVVDALSAGASGYVLKDCAAAELCDALRAVRNHHVYLSPAVAGVVVRDYLGRLAKMETAGHSHLTARERQVLQLIAEGHSTKDIAVGLKISAKTVATHREHLGAKLGIHGAAGLTRYAIRRGIISADYVGDTTA